MSSLFPLIPKMDVLLAHPTILSAQSDLPYYAIKDGCHTTLDKLRDDIRSGAVTEMPSMDALASNVIFYAKRLCQPHLRRVINGTGVVLHTNLGRAPLGEIAANAVFDAARGYSNLEYDIEAGKRGSRFSHVEDLLCTLTGTEAAIAVNNNAAAVFLMLSALAAGKRVAISRGELVEIGGSFRVPEVMAQSGCSLMEVGTTNKTRLSDYEAALGENTAALLKVHSSNYRIVGFTQSAGIAELSGLAGRAGIPVLYDIGSGAMLPLRDMGRADEPGPAEALRDGASLVTFSGDKLLGGPQAGIVAGDPELIGKMKRHPLMRALRPGKMSLAALEATLQLLRDPVTARRELPLYAMLSQSEDALRQRAQAIKDALADIRGAEAWVIQTQAQVGGGSTPGQMIPSFGLALRPLRGSVAALCARLRGGETPVIGRVQHDSLVLDMRTLREGETAPLTAALRAALTEGEERHA